jgi:hypothetical protein
MPPDSFPLGKAKKSKIGLTSILEAAFLKYQGTKYWLQKVRHYDKEKIS